MPQPGPNGSPDRQYDPSAQRWEPTPPPSQPTPYGEQQGPSPFGSPGSPNPGAGGYGSPSSPYGGGQQPYTGNPASSYGQGWQQGQQGPGYGPNQGAPYGGFPQAGGPGAPQKPIGLAVAGFIVAIIAFFVGWVPVLGLILGFVGIVLCVIALVKNRLKGLSGTGVALASLAAITSLITTIAVFAAEGSGSSAGGGSSSSSSGEQGAAEPIDIEDYEELSDRDFSLMAKSPEDHSGEHIVIHGAVEQIDGNTGSCSIRVMASGEPKSDTWDYDENTMAVSGDGDSDCPDFDPLLEGDQVKMWVTTTGGYSYDSLGGATTVLSYQVDELEQL